MDGFLQFYVHFNSISAISGRLLGDNERLFALKSRLRLDFLAIDQSVM